MDDLTIFGGDKDPLIVKLDIEGAQAQLFSSNTDWVDGSTLIPFLELDDWLLPWQGARPQFLFLSLQVQI